MFSLPIIIGIALVNLCILYLIIQAATKSNAIHRQSIIQTNLLAKIAEKNGVTADEIKQCF